MKLTILGIGLVASIAFVSPAKSAEDQFSVEIIRSTQLQKDLLFSQTILWMAESFRSSKEVIDFKDKELGTIIGNGVTDINLSLITFLPVNAPIIFKVRIDVRDQRYKIMFTQVRLVVQGAEKPIEQTNRESNESKARERFEKIADSLDRYLSMPRKDF